MAIGILTLAVVTAQVSSSFVDQAARRRSSTTASATASDEASVTDLAQRLSRIEALLTAPSAAVT